MTPSVSGSLPGDHADASIRVNYRRLRDRAGTERRRLPGYEVLQYHHSYLRRRTDRPTLRSPDGEVGVAAGDLFSCLRAEPELALVAYSPLRWRSWTRAWPRWTWS